MGSTVLPWRRAAGGAHAFDGEFPDPCPSAAWRALCASGSGRHAGVMASPACIYTTCRHPPLLFLFSPGGLEALSPGSGPPRPWCDTPSIRLQYASIKESELSPSDHPTVFPMCPSCPLPQFRSRSTLPVCFSAPRARPPPPASNYDRLVGEGPRRVPRRPAPGPCSRFRMPAPCLTACPPSPTQRPHTHPMAAQPTDPSTLSPPRASALPSFHCLAVFSGPL